MAKKYTSKQAQCGPVPDWYRAVWKPSYFCTYAKHTPGLLALDDAMLGKLYRAQISYLLDRASTPPADGIVSLAFNFVKASMDEDFEHGISRAWSAYFASHSREGVSAPKDGGNVVATSDDVVTMSDDTVTSEYITQEQQEHLTQEHLTSITSKHQNNKTSSTQSTRETRESKGDDDLKDDDSIDDISSSFDSSLLEKFFDWVCSLHGYSHTFDETEFAYFRYCHPGMEENLDSMLRYIYERIMQGGVQMGTLQADAKAFLKEKARREKLGLAVVPSDWSEARMKELFSILKLKDEDKQMFYDTDTSHTEDNALRWIADNCFNGEVTSKELRARLDDARREQALQKLAKIPTDKVTSTAVKAYAQIRGYTHIDASRIINADIHGSWMKYVDACERKGRDQAEKEREEPQPPQEQGFIDF